MCGRALLAKLLNGRVGGGFYFERSDGWVFKFAIGSDQHPYFQVGLARAS
jgi:hypothetical protein